MKPSEFLSTYLPFAQRAEADSGIPAMAILAQSALETGFGNSCPGNMMFGIKAGKGYTGLKQLLKTTEVHCTASVQYPEVISVTQRTDGRYVYKVRDYFRAYPSPYESFMDYVHFIKENPRYKKALLQKEPASYLSEIAKAGYATDPGYFQKLQRIVKDFAVKP